MTRAEAKSLGKTTYNTGKPCVNGHVADRRTSNAKCIVCDSLNNQKIYARDRARNLARSKSYYAAHKEQCKKASRDWARNNIARRKIYVKLNSQYYAAKCAERRSRIPKWLTETDLKAIQDFYRACPVGHHVDHIIPLKGRTVSGLHVLSNLQYLPAEENLRKSNSYDT